MRVQDLSTRSGTRAALSGLPTLTALMIAGILCIVAAALIDRWLW